VSLPRWSSSHLLRRCFSTSSHDDKIDDKTYTDLFNEIPSERVRNFSIIAHVDHGKSTLADRLLESTGAIKTVKSNKQVLDSLKVEQERGITVKSQTASLIYHDPATNLPYLLNLIDTPGHVDFSYEVSRSLAACQGALLLVDSTQGVQAQTLANYRTAIEANLTIIPCLTKLDLSHSDPAKAIEQIEQAFGFEEDEILWTSAKSGEGVDEIPAALINRIPPPTSQRELPFRGLIVDSWHNSFRGVTCLLSTVDGSVSKGDEIAMASTGKKFEVQEVGLLTPNAVPVDTLHSGHVGYLVCGMKDTADARVGDTLIDPTKTDLLPLPGFRPVKAMLFSSVYPVNAGDFDDLRQALDRLILNDSSVSVQAEASSALGQGFRCGFLGKLHMEVFHQRLSDEHGQQVISTAPMVPFEAHMTDGTVVMVEKPSEMAPLLGNKLDAFYETIASVEVVTPPEYVGGLMDILQKRRGKQQDIVHLDADQVVLKYLIPWQEVVADMYDEIKSISSGYASFDYDDAGSERADVVCVDMLINGEAIDALSFVCSRSVAEKKGREVALRLKKVVTRQQFDIIIQASIGARIVAKERIPPFKKDVLTKGGKSVSGSDRKKKLLEKQKRGKKLMKRVGNVELSQKAFMTVLHR